MRINYTSTTVVRTFQDAKLQQLFFLVKKFNLQTRK